MCGILGYFGSNVQNFTSKVSLDAIAHRGPDFANATQGNTYFLGQTRLSILDLSENGNQPMFSSDNKYVIIFNGEIYNHLELRSEYLPNQNFKSTSDTETLLYGLIHYGIEFISKLNGIFAFSFYNIETKDFIIARDHFGIKPLYYYIGINEICFSSELKAILPFKKELEVDNFALKNYINFLWAPGELTPEKEFKKLHQGCYIKGNSEEMGKGEIVKYYHVPFTGKYLQKTEKQWIDELENKLIESVQRQMLSDVPVGFFLSGGLDSSLLVAIAKKIHPNSTIECFTLKTEEVEKEGFASDFEYAKSIAKHLDVNLNIVEGKIDILKDFDKIVFHLDEPQADPAPIHVLNICKAAREKGIKVLIGGTAGDDVFSGYRRHVAIPIIQKMQLIPLFLRKVIKKVASLFNRKSSFGRRINKLFYNIDQPINDTMLGYFDWIDNETLENLFIDKNTKDKHLYFKEIIKSIPNEKSNLNKMLFWELNTFLVSHNLNYTDKLSMATGVEVRVPYLDVELVNFSTNIPPEFKLKGKEAKYLLKKVAERYLPHDVIYRPKTGFGGPVREWILNDMDAIINDYLSKETITKRGIFNYEKVQQLIADNKKGTKDVSYPIWSLLAIESWMRQFVDKNN
ncbi:asparagine synthase (glutamine-hydrolyzing) [Flavobacterium urocaniciphilum]|uniref:asparagine synthase (glutamine-hydrolyzing) n=1 Tax=Flavobacterium urocaniciphilum TaxID=1299341 RepID=A0A1H8YRW1_9FLAO|nr:asparagine synthase (glutamine-hydrolyzing) [Flavobacterium urocaniciphilum]SEP54782.1 asparagine synthase (glutamine-hydrolysing) [Flavobacterium urocaniciphilum]